MRAILTVLFMAMCCNGISAQKSIRGTVTDSVTGKPLEMANITLLRQGKPIRFTKTNANGVFTVSVLSGDELRATFLGYRKQVVTIPSGNTVNISLAPEAFLLKEVMVKGAPVTGRADTITYDLSRYATGRDNTLSDVLKRLPGVDVSKSGQVTYLGEPIKRFTVEGLDLTGGRYRKMTEALKAKDVDKAEVIEHDQPVKALHGKVFTDDVAMNIKLKAEARDKWLPTLSPRLGIGDDIYLGGKAEVLQVGKVRQQLYEGELDRTGRQLSYNNMRLASSTYSADSRETDLPEWFSIPELSEPIDGECLRRNLSHNWDFSRIAKKEQDIESRFTANYLHTTEWQATENESQYYLTNEPTITRQNRQMHLSRDAIDLSFNQKLNQAKAYGNESLTAELAFTDGIANINSVINQCTKQTKIYLQNAFNRLFVNDNYQLSVFSDIELARDLSRLQINDKEQQLNDLQAYTHNYLSWLRQRLFSTISIKGGFKTDYLNVKGDNMHLTFYAAPSYKWEHNRLTVRASMTVEWEYFTRQRRSFLSPSPSLSLNYKPNSRAEWHVYGNYSHQTGSWADFALDDYQTDYRTYHHSSGIIPRTRAFASGLNYTYKRPVREFFWVCRAGYSHIRSNAASDLQIIDGKYYRTYTALDTDADSYSLSTDISKGFFEWRVKTRLGIRWSYSLGQQASGGSLIGFNSHSLMLTPEISWSPTWCDITYNSNFTRSSSHSDNATLEPLLNWRQSLSLTKTIKKIDLTLSGVHYHNQIKGSPILNTLLADASIVWREEKIRLYIDIRNLLNQHEYQITRYSNASSSTSIYHLRPREIIAGIQWSL